ncbi:MAG: prephenate dehydrogenase/arogenate dehydrogenase family protein [Gammaproteobacteria bacterium]
MSDSEQSIAALRGRLTAVDRQLLALVRERQQLVEEIGKSKRVGGTPTRDFVREKEVVEGAKAEADRLGLPAGMAESLMGLLIRSSLTTQEQARVAAEGSGDGRTALVIGGAGRIGRWFCDFLSSQGYDVVVADPGAVQDRYEQVRNWQETDLEHDLVIVAAPLRISATILEELASRRPPGLIFDVGSLKTPLAGGLRKLAEAGCRVTSIHPMFGPDTRLLSGRHVIFVDVGCQEATDAAMALFEPTMAERVSMELQAHDRLIAYVLGLSHALNIAFFTALAESGEDVPHLAGISSTTFDNQLAVSSCVAEENPWLYFEIQALNDYGLQPLEALEKSVTELVSAIRSGDGDRFVDIMRKGRAYLAKRQGVETG